MTREPAKTHWMRMQEAAEEHMPAAFGSLLHSALVAVLTLHPDAEAALACLKEQQGILARIMASGLIPFAPHDDMDQAHAWLDARIDAMDISNPLLARYAELHKQRFRWHPARH